jgi:arylsulfatase A-like enzyme
MKIKIILKRALVIAFVVSQTLINAQVKPNIIFIYADDLDADEVNYSVNDNENWATFTGAAQANITTGSKLGIPKLLTPNIDEIAQQGVVFTRFYITSTVCTPSRYSLMTGRLATRGEEFNERFPNGEQVNLDWSPAVIRSETNLPKELQKLGYHTGIVGKWHNLPKNLDLPKLNNKITAADASYENVKANESKLKESYRIAQEYLSDGFGWDVVDRMEWGNSIVNLRWMAEGALKFIDESKNEPFFLYVPLPVPHGQYKYGYNNLSRLDPRVCANGILDEIPTPLPSNEDVYKRLKENGIPEENVMATHMDDYVGAILDKLDELGLRENTLVIFTSDHGSRGKNTCYEGAARIPLFASWPRKITPGTTSESLTANIDVAATLIDIAGGIPPEDMTLDGRSFLPQLLGNPEPENWRTSLFLEAGNTRAVVTKQWKYIANRVSPEIEQLMGEQPHVIYWSGVDHHNYDSEKIYPGYWDADQLYNLDKDLFEQKNIFKSDVNSKVISELKNEMNKYVSGLPHRFGEFGKE